MNKLSKGKINQEELDKARAEGKETTTTIDPKIKTMEENMKQMSDNLMESQGIAQKAWEAYATVVNKLLTIAEQGNNIFKDFFGQKDKELKNVKTLNAEYEKLFSHVNQ